MAKGTSKHVVVVVLASYGWIAAEILPSFTVMIAHGG
jgi:hypothetical protein